MKILITGLVLLLSVCTIQAQNVERITLEEAIQIALENNYQLQQAKNFVDLADYQILSAKADYLPSVSHNYSVNVRQGRQFIPASDEFGDFMTRSVGSSVSASLTIFDGFSNINNLRSTRYEKLSREENLNRLKEQIIFNTASRYLDYLLNIELLEIAEEDLNTSIRQLEQVEAQVEVGSRPTIDLLNQESVVASNELTVINRQNDVDFSRLVLLRQLQVDPLGEYEFIFPDIDQNLMPSADLQLEELVEAALMNRSDLKAEESSILAAEHRLRMAKGNLLPTLNLNASLSTDYALAFLDGESRAASSFSDQFFNENINQFIGLNLSIPIFANLNRREFIRQQEVSFRNAQLDFENTRLQVIQEVNQAYNDYQSIIKQLESTLKALIAAERAFETEQQRYEIGASTLIELSQSNANFVQAQSNRAQAVYRFIFQERLLDYFIGQLDIEITLN